MNSRLNYTLILLLPAVIVSSMRDSSERGTVVTSDCYVRDSTDVVKSSCELAQSYFEGECYRQSVEILRMAYDVVGRNSLTSLEGDVVYALARSCAAAGDYALAFRYNFKSLEVNELNSNRLNTALSLSNLAMLYYQIGYYQKALEYFEKGLQARNEIKYNVDREFVLLDIALCYYSMQRYQCGNEFIRAAFAGRLDRLSNAFKMKASYAVAFAAFGTADMARAEAACAISLEKAVLLDNKVYQAYNLLLLARVCRRQNALERAKAMLEKGLMIAVEFHLHDVQVNIYRQFIKIHIHDPVMLIHFQKKLIGLKESIYNATLNNQLAKAQGDYEEEQYVRTIMLQQEAIRVKAASLRTQKYIGLGSFIVITVFAGLIGFLHITSRQEKKFGILLAQKVRERACQLRRDEKVIAVSYAELLDTITEWSQKVLRELTHFELNEGLEKSRFLTGDNEPGIHDTIKKIGHSIARLTSVDNRDDMEKNKRGKLS